MVHTGAPVRRLFSPAHTCAPSEPVTSTPHACLCLHPNSFQSPYASAPRGPITRNPFPGSPLCPCCWLTPVGAPGCDALGATQPDSPTVSIPPSPCDGSLPGPGLGQPFKVKRFQRAEMVSSVHSSKKHLYFTSTLSFCTRFYDSSWDRDDGKKEPQTDDPKPTQ